MPFDCDDFARAGLYALMENVREVCLDHNEALIIEGIVVNQYQARASLPQQVVAALKAEGLHQTTRLFLATGVLGGFTTFSAFSLEVAEFLRKGETVKAGAYAGLSLLLGVMALFIGLWIARKVFA